MISWCDSCTVYRGIQLRIPMYMLISIDMNHTKWLILGKRWTIGYLKKIYRLLSDICFPINRWKMAIILNTVSIRIRDAIRSPQLAGWRHNWQIYYDSLCRPRAISDSYFYLARLWKILEILDEHIEIVNGYFKKRNHEWFDRQRIGIKTYEYNE